jgi:hypothetical protein
MTQDKGFEELRRLRQLAVSGELYFNPASRPGAHVTRIAAAELENGSLYQFPLEPGGWSIGKVYSGKKENLVRVFPADAKIMTNELLELRNKFFAMLLDNTGRDAHPGDAFTVS